MIDATTHNAPPAKAVSLPVFRCALPVVVHTIDDAEQLRGEIDCPQLFLGLPDAEQVAVINGVLSTVVRHIDHWAEVSCNPGPPLVKTLQRQHFPLRIGVSVRLRKIADFQGNRAPSNPGKPRDRSAVSTAKATRSLEVDLCFPDTWVRLPATTKVHVLRSVAYLMQVTATAIAGRRVAGERT